MTKNAKTDDVTFVYYFLNSGIGVAAGLEKVEQCFEESAGFELGEDLREDVHGQMRSMHGRVVEAAEGFHQLVAME